MNMRGHISLHRNHMLVESSIEICKIDWNSYEISWDFCKHPLMPQREEEGITIFAGMKIGEEKWIKKLYDGEVCFSPVGDFIVEGETTGNNEQGDKYEGVFARLKKDNPLIRKMNETLGDGRYRTLDSVIAATAYALMALAYCCFLLRMGIKNDKLKLLFETNRIAS